MDSTAALGADTKAGRDGGEGVAVTGRAGDAEFSRVVLVSETKATRLPLLDVLRPLSTLRSRLPRPPVIRSRRRSSGLGLLVRA